MVSLCLASPQGNLGDVNSLWEGNQNVDENGLPPLTETVPMPEVKPRKPEKDISEPVLSFIKLYKANHRRFKITLETYSDPAFTTYTYKLLDRVENKSFSIVERHGFLDSVFRQSTGTKWMTQDEMEFCFNEIREFMIDRKQRIQNKKNIHDRQRLVKLYKGE